jgi:hypothetical protein
MQDVAQKILNKCSGCMLAVSILGSVLSNTKKNGSAWENVYAQFKYYASAKEYTPCDYNGTIFAAIDLSLNHDANEMFSKDLMWNVLQALSLFRSAYRIPSCVVKLAWKSMQPEGEAKYFEAVVNSLIHKNLVDGSADEDLSLHDLVGEYVELNKPIDLVTILCDEEGELKQGREFLAIFLHIYGKVNDEDPFKILSRAGAVVPHDSLVFSLHWLLDSGAENAILAIFQLYKATQQDAKALLHLMHDDEDQKLIAAEVLVSLMLNDGTENLLVDGDIESFVQLCTHILREFSENIFLPIWWLTLMWKMARCSVFAKRMICHKPLLILIAECIRKYDLHLLEYVGILVALIVYVQSIRNTRSDSRGSKVRFFEPKFLFEVLQPLQQHIQQHIQMTLTPEEINELELFKLGYDSITILYRLVDFPNCRVMTNFNYLQIFCYLKQPEVVSFLEELKLEELELQNM